MKLAPFAMLAASAIIVAPSLSAQDYVEIQGVQEFTGQMMARPVQVDARTPETYQQHESGHAQIQQFNVLEYRAHTDVYVFEVNPGTENNVAAALMGTGAFEYVEPNWLLFPVGCPNDSLFNNQWHHDNNIMESCPAWDKHTGNPSTVVALCDTGLRVTHQDFQLHRQEGYNAVDRIWENNGGDISNVHPHGTMVSGCAAANGNNGVGISGVGWDLGHRMMRVSNSSGGGAYLSDLQHAAETAIETGDRVASVSYSGVSSSGNRTTATYIKSIGGLLCWSAGNDNANLNWGNRDADDILVCGATDSSDNKASFSAYGPSVDLVAPGVSVYTSDDDNDSDYTSVSGTSFSCPLTAGLCALIWSYDPSLTPDQVEGFLKAGCDDLGSSGIDDTFGHGRINSHQALCEVDGGGNDPVLPADGLLLTFQEDENLGGVASDRSDVVHLNTNTGAWSMIFDASDVGMGGNPNLDAVAVLDDGSLILSFAEDGTSVPGVGTVDDEDLVQFTPTAWGDSTAGSFSMYFDGSDVGLAATKEDISAVSVDNLGRLHISTKGPFDVGGGIVGKNEDILEFTPTSLGSSTSGTWFRLFDGTGGDTSLGKKGEQIAAFHYRLSDGDMLISTGGDFRVPVSQFGDDDDILEFSPTALGDPTLGTYIILHDLGTFGVSDANNVNGLVEL